MDVVNASTPLMKNGWDLRAQICGPGPPQREALPSHPPPLPGPPPLRRGGARARGQGLREAQLELAVRAPEAGESGGASDRLVAALLPHIPARVPHPRPPPQIEASGFMDEAPEEEEEEEEEEERTPKKGKGKAKAKGKGASSPESSSKKHWTSEEESAMLKYHGKFQKESRGKEVADWEKIVMKMNGASPHSIPAKALRRQGAPPGQAALRDRRGALSHHGRHARYGRHATPRHATPCRTAPHRATHPVPPPRPPLPPFRPRR